MDWTLLLLLRMLVAVVVVVVPIVVDYCCCCYSSFVAAVVVGQCCSALDSVGEGYGMNPLSCTFYHSGGVFDLFLCGES